MKASIKSISNATLMTVAMSTSVSAQIQGPGGFEQAPPSSGPSLAQLGGTTAYVPMKRLEVRGFYLTVRTIKPRQLRKP